MTNSGNLCASCGGPTIELFFSRACKAECDLRAVSKPPKFQGIKVEGNVPGTYQIYRTVIGQAVADPKQDFENYVREVLADPTTKLAGMRFLRIDYFGHGTVHRVVFAGSTGKVGFVTCPYGTLPKNEILQDMIDLSKLISTP